MALIGIIGSITHLSFPTRTHLLSASEDGTICLYHTRDWAVLATLKGHRDRVNDLAVHPSAKVCLSVGKDQTLRMWDLMRGKGSASMKIGKGACLSSNIAVGSLIQQRESACDGHLRAHDLRYLQDTALIFTLL
jgi:protein MAK11